MDDAVVNLLSKLAASGAIEDTVIILRGDHGLQARRLRLVYSSLVSVVISVVYNHGLSHNLFNFCELHY